MASALSKFYPFRTHNRCRCRAPCKGRFPTGAFAWFQFIGTATGAYEGFRDFRVMPQQTDGDVCNWVIEAVLNGHAYSASLSFVPVSGIGVPLDWLFTFARNWEPTLPAVGYFASSGLHVTEQIDCRCLPVLEIFADYPAVPGRFPRSTLDGTVRLVYGSSGRAIDDGDC